MCMIMHQLQVDCVQQLLTLNGTISAKRMG